MPDIAKCVANECPLKLLCFRHTSTDDPEQTYMMHPPYTVLENGGIECTYFYFNGTKNIDRREMSQSDKYLNSEYGNGHTFRDVGHISPVRYAIFFVQRLEGPHQNCLLIGYTLFIESEYNISKELTRIDLVEIKDDGAYSLLNRVFENS